MCSLINNAKVGLIKLCPDQELEFCRLLKSLCVPLFIFAPHLAGTTILTFMVIISWLSFIVLLAVRAFLNNIYPLPPEPPSHHLPIPGLLVVTECQAGVGGESKKTEVISLRSLKE